MELGRPWTETLSPLFPFTLETAQPNGDPLSKYLFMDHVFIFVCFCAFHVTPSVMYHVFHLFTFVSYMWPHQRLTMSQLLGT